MKVALILPIDCMDLLSDYNTKYHLVLPDLCWKSQKYFEVYRDIEGFKIMDNGAAEGKEIYHVDLHDISTSIGADEVVVPDVLGDYEGTITAVRAFERWARPDDFSYAGVVQGSSMAEIVACLNFYDQLPWITNVHIPRILNRTIHRTFRFTFLDALFNQTGSKYEYKFNNIHCLGASEWAREVGALTDVPIVRGMDTSLVGSMALADKLLGIDDYVQRQPDFFDREVQRYSTTWKILCGNIERYLEWAGCEYGNEGAETS